MLTTWLRLETVKKRMSEAVLAVLEDKMEDKMDKEEDEEEIGDADTEASGLLANFIDLDPPLDLITGKLIMNRDWSSADRYGINESLFYEFLLVLIVLLLRATYVV
jgi:hypothetical protein